MDSTFAKETVRCFQLKTHFLPYTLLQLTRYDLSLFEKQLIASVKQAPLFFAGSPVVIDLERLQSLNTPIDFIKLKAILSAQGMILMGIRYGNPEQVAQAEQVGLPVLNLGRTVASVEDKKLSADQPHTSPTKVIYTPIRSGMQVYAKEGDLVVLGQVSTGAEMMADGYIHVYGTLRGRALAGVKGNTRMRIFCQGLEAELVSIAGYYLTQEEMQPLPMREGKLIQICLEDEQVKVVQQ